MTIYRTVPLLVSLYMIVLTGCTVTSATSVTPTLAVPTSTDTMTATSSVLPTASSLDLAAIAPLVQANNTFAFNLYQQVTSQQDVAPDDNVIFSPYSIFTALGMLYAGARGEIQAQIARVVANDLPPEQLHEGINALDMILQELVAIDTSLSVTNALWLQEGFTVAPTYLELLNQYYGLGVHAVDFAGDARIAEGRINEWIAAAKSRRITEAFTPGSIPPTTRMLLLNTIQFSGVWSYVFHAESTREADFFVIDGSPVTVPMMTMWEGYTHCTRGEDYHALELRYGDAFASSMVLIMPDAGKFDQIEARLDAALLDTISETLSLSNLLNVHMPRFAFSRRLELDAVLTSMGLTAPFDQTADFSGITSAESLRIGVASHQTSISVDESGTEVASVTEFRMIPLSAVSSPCGNEIILDRPFIFAIRHNDTGAILFLGRVMNPNGD